MKILQETQDYLICIKPAGILSENEGMPLLLENEYREKGQELRIYPVHRLDRETAGLMIYAKHKKAAAELSQGIADGKLHKSYLTVVQGRPEPSAGTMEDFLFKDSKKNKSYVVKGKRRGVRCARLNYQVLATAEYGEHLISLVRVQLITGRSHQIRVQFASRQMPIVGDRKYGSAFHEPLALWSTNLWMEGRFHCEAFPEPENVWKKFEFFEKNE